MWFPNIARQAEAMNDEDRQRPPRFNGEQFSKFTPLWPQANATAERFMRTLGKCLYVAHMENIPWKKHLYTFLRE